jgi:tRNA pseudouridine38-40 synthase
MRYFLKFAYKGTHYHGWQVQPNDVSVQSVMTEKMSMVLRCPIELVGAGRTDAGVHARCMYAHFDVENEILDPPLIVNKLNALLPPDIAVYDLYRVDDDLHARFSAKYRTYRYYVATRKSPFLHDFAARFTFPLDVEKMNEAASKLLEYSDFTSFSKLHTDVKTNDCDVSFAHWEKRDDCLVFTITANRFLRNMVRAVVGTLVEVGKGKLSVAQFCEVIEKKNRCAAGMSVPAQGLFLEDVGY